VSFSLPRLEPQETYDVHATPVWGPRSVGDHVLAVIEQIPYDEIELNSGETVQVQPLNRSKVSSLAAKEVIAAQRLDGQAQEIAGADVKKIRHYDELVAEGLSPLRLICLDDQGRLLWETALPADRGALCGEPAAAEGGFVLASRFGIVWKIRAQSGEEVSQLATGQPLAAGPLAINGTQLVLTGRDATLHVAALP
jgi:hypothetical protein